MMLAYMDESAEKGLYLIAALVVPGDQLASLTAALDKVMIDAAERHGIDYRTELHAHELMRGKNQPWSGIALPDRVAIYASVFLAIASHDVAILTHALDIEAQRRRYTVRVDPPHHVVLTFLVEHVDRYANSKQQPVLLIADDVSGPENYREDLRYYQRVGTWGWKGRKLTNIVDTIHFAPSDASRLLQGVDLIAYLARRRTSKVVASERATLAANALWKLLEPKVVHAGFWVPQPR